MKKIVLSFLAAAALVACATEDTIVAPQGDAIAFGTPFVDNATKAIDYSYGENNLLKKIYVYGTVKGTAENSVSIFNHTKVWTDAEDGDYTKLWQCATTQYWIPGADYKFVAINGMGETALEAGALENGLPKTLTFTSEGKTDLVAGYYATKAGDTNSTVSFNMSHLLSKVKFTVENETNKNDNTANSGFYYKVTDIKLTNAATSGTCTLSYPSNNTVSGEWTSTKTNVEFGNATNATATTASTDAIAIEDRASVTSHHDLLVVPANYPNTVDGKLGVSFKVGLYTIEDGNEVTFNEPVEKTAAVAVDLQAGYAYNFIIKVAIGQLIQFTVASNPTWTNEQTETVYTDTVIIK